MLFGGYRISASFVGHLLWVAHCSCTSANVTTSQFGNISSNDGLKPLCVHARAGLLFVGISTHDATGASEWRAAQRTTWLRWLTAKPRTDIPPGAAILFNATSPELEPSIANSVVDPDGVSYRYFLHSVPSALSVIYRSSHC
jgi:hypothetical protein